MVFLGYLLALPLVPAQGGDVPGEEQPPLPAGLSVPPAPVRDPLEELASFALAPGLRVELVAAEPLVHEPVALAFDEDGDLWVVEMRGYMPDVDGRDEHAAVGSVAVLRDRDGDGVMDERRLFLDRLVLPRAVHPARGGALVIAPPHLLHARDEDGDGLADRVEVVEEVGRLGLDNPEHAINGLCFALEGGFRCANAPTFVRATARGWSIERTAGGGQWGIARDDLGRFYYNNNSDPLRGDLYDSRYAIRNPSLGTAWGVDLRIAEGLEVFPSRVTPGVNRGYRAETLREDHRLRRFTAACSPAILRGDAFPGWIGNAVVAEPAANLLKLLVVREREDGTLEAEDAWPGRELWTSSDERFRPVDVEEGPDGALYVADLYRGILQHRVFLTSFLRRQILDRGLDRGTGRGRIWRLVPEGFERREPPRLGSATWTELAAALSHPSGWWRDTAQRLIQEEGHGERDAIELCRAAARGSVSPLGRVHALWALRGIDALEREDVERALADGDARVVEQAVRLSEPWLAGGDPTLAGALAELARAGPLRVRRQVLLSLGSAVARPADAALAQLAREGLDGAAERSLLLSGLHQRELDFLAGLLADPVPSIRPIWSDDAPGRAELVEELAACVTSEGRTLAVERLIGLAALRVRTAPCDAAAIARGMLAGRAPDPRGEPGPIRLAREPPGLEPLVRLASPQARATVEALSAALVWPGRPGARQDVAVRPLDEREARRFERGRGLYAQVCAACHQLSGRGSDSAPALRSSRLVLGEPARLCAVVLQGLRGEAEGARAWEQEMPAFAAGDEEIAALATYLRREWGHGVEPVEPALVAAVRASLAHRGGPWTRSELASRYGE